eukprot:CAMPEP_0168627428 /NCGR_PEP_ID=MMETSP0449_2-20121227/11247_1 /TAXON_ID=1082188 /ORGANISM="Strombidium rassoulzadegani, Strain ras09" /LENGTH=62 /DNA_ID=CAMNT_0008669663 /DNA_START=301 /DNA_END=489 /DNA_ORIENTATION=-
MFKWDNDHVMNPPNSVFFGQVTTANGTTPTSHLSQAFTPEFKAELHKKPKAIEESPALKTLG